MADLDPRTLRWVVRVLRKTQRETRASALRNKSAPLTYEFFRGYCSAATQEADGFLQEARAIERAKKGWKLRG